MDLVGRDRVERFLSEVGHSTPTLNHPFLSTREMAALKGEPDAAITKEYLEATVELRRRLLRGPVAAVPLETLLHKTWGEPVLIRELEWFASMEDLLSLLDWLRQRLDGPNDPLNQILTANRGVELHTPAWLLIGYKGGSEPGVSCGAWLAQRLDGQWFMIASAVNNPNGLVDTAYFDWVCRAIFGLLGKSAGLDAEAG